MKKWLWVLAALFATPVLAAGPTSVVQAAASPGALVLDYVGGTGHTLTPSDTVAAEVGDTFTIENRVGQKRHVMNAGGQVSVGGVACTTSTSCELPNGATTTITVVAAGRLDFYSETSPPARLTQGLTYMTITSTSSSPGGGATELLKGTFDANGGSCLIADVVRESIVSDVPDDRLMTSWAYHFVTPSYMPGEAECSRQGYRFTGWQEDDSETTLPVLVDERDDVRRHFVGSNCGDSVGGCAFTAGWEEFPDPRLDVEIDGRGLVFTFDGIYCGEGYGVGVFAGILADWSLCGVDGEATRTLYAVPMSGVDFLAWGGACADTPVTSSCTVPVSGPATVSARFGLLDLDVETRGGGTIREFTFGAPRIDCGSTCETGLTRGSSIWLIAEPSPGQYFQEWGGGCAGTATSDPCLVTMTGDTTVSATFSSGNRLIVDIEPRAGNTGVVWSVPFGVLCGGPWTLCDVSFAPDVDDFTIFAINGQDHQFIGWGGDCDGTATTSVCSVTFDDDTTSRSIDVSYESRQWIQTEVFDSRILSVSRDGRTVATNTSVFREDPSTGTWEKVFSGEVWYQWVVALSGDGSTLVECSERSAGLLEEVVRRWNGTTREWDQVGSPFGPSHFTCQDASLSDDGRVLRRSQIFDWNSTSNTWVQRPTPPGHLQAREMNSDGSVAVFGSEDDAVTFTMFRWNMPSSTWEQIRIFERTSVLGISDDGHTVFVIPLAAPGTRAVEKFNPVMQQWSTVETGLITGLSPKGDRWIVAETTGLFECSNFVVRHWDSAAQVAVQRGETIATTDFCFREIGEDGLDRVALWRQLYEWRFPSR